ncbi:hypothetical protein [Cryptosporangium phraense]|uniref:SH3 domain-containing protein n=1 Tax=Cryptosporangium phraense TaxID=2593070 RepID=A0A545ATT2_9ACTN|nr:hypothetical protein [Cryptosporangium phraense]TQS44734.1 hypothetical protein FL583_12255 [Cryptosporangium phraense]
METVGTALLVPGAIAGLAFVFYMLFFAEGHITGLIVGIVWIFSDGVRAGLAVIILAAAALGGFLISAAPSDGNGNGGDSVSSSGVTSADQPAAEAAPSPAEYCVIGSPAARMRTDPASSSDQIARILQGTCGIYDAAEGAPELQAGPATSGETVDWRHVRYGTATGWIVDSFLR